MSHFRTEAGGPQHGGGERAHEEAPGAAVQIVEHHAERASFRLEDFAGHSLRAGFLTSGAESGASIFKLMEVSRHKSMDTLRGYVRRAELFKDHAGSGFL